MIEITIKNYRCFSDEKPVRFIIGDGFTSFLGINNSGKSTLLKFFYEFRNALNKISGPDLLDVLKGTSNISVPRQITDISELFPNFNDRNLSFEIKISNLQLDDEIVDKFKIKQIPNRIVVTISRDLKASGELYRDNEKIQKTELQDTNWEGREGKRNGILVTKGARCYTRPLQKPIAELADSTYVGPFRNAIPVGASNPYLDISIGVDFIEKWRNLKTGPGKQGNEQAYELQRYIQSIFDYEDFEILPSEDNSTLVIFISGKSYKLSELGAGLTQFIVVFTNLLIKQPKYVLIDEPESNLHPKLQLDFLSTLQKYSKKGVVFATHNIGLSRAYSDRAYTIRILRDGKREVKELEATPRLSEFLGEMSFSSLRELGFDNLLLVEGRTSVKLFQQILRKLKAGHKFLVLPLGGADMINDRCEEELSEVRRICENIYVVIDSEKNNSRDQVDASRKAFRKLCRKIKIKCHILKWRSIENYLPDYAVKEVLGMNYRSLKPYEKLSDLELGWSKTNNWRIAQRVKIEDFIKTDLGIFMKKITT